MKVGDFMEENKLKTIEGELEAPADFTSPDVLYRDLVASIRKYHPSDDLSMIEKAYQLADNAVRLSVEETLSTPIQEQTEDIDIVSEPEPCMEFG